MNLFGDVLMKPPNRCLQAKARERLMITRTQDIDDLVHTVNRLISYLRLFSNDVPGPRISFLFSLLPPILLDDP